MCFLSHSRILDRLRSKSRKHEEGRVRNGRATPVESILLPATSVPHRDGNSHSNVLEDAKALREMFSTPSSIRGYEAARVIPGGEPSLKRFVSSADVARLSPTRSASSKLGALGHAVKQRLSESRLSKESSKTILKKKNSHDSLGARGRVSNSCTSTGLTDLLMSRTASEGGYDSDAKDISTLRLTKSVDDESSKPNPEYISKAICPKVDLPTEKATSTLSTQEHMQIPVAVPAGNPDVLEREKYDETAPATSHIQEVGMSENTKGTRNGSVQQEEGQRIESSTFESLSEDHSFHLGDMRISQRLASTSAMPMSSLSSTKFGSGTGNDDGIDLSPERACLLKPDPQPSSMDNDLPWHLQVRPTIAGRYASFVAQEHNRKPSDPGTRKLFEEAAEVSKLHSKWKSVNHTNKMQAGVKGGQSIGDNANSHFIGECELPESGTADLANVAHSETIKNANSLAVPGRRASAGMGQRYGSLGQLSNAEEVAWFADSRHKKRHSLQDFEDLLTPHEKAAHAGPENSGRERTSRESRFIEEPMHQHSRELQRLLPSLEANEGMSEITDGTLQEKWHERMSEAAPHAEVLRYRSRGDRHDTRSTSEGWLTQGRRSGYGYDFIKTMPSWDSRLSHEKDGSRGPRNETATLIWDRAFRKAREEGPIENSSKSMLCVPFWTNLASRKTSRSSLNEQEAHGFTRPRSVASERRATPSELTSEHLHPLGDDQRTIFEAQKPPPTLSAQWSVKTGNGRSSLTTSLRKSPNQKSIFNVRRYTISGVNNESKIPPTAVRHDFPSWCRFSSHTREENNASAGEKDSVKVKDFCPLNPGLEKCESSSRFTIQKNRSASSHAANVPESWRKRALGHVRRKSKSMTFSHSSASPKHKAANRGLFWQMRDFYRSQSSDLRRFQGGHRSSVTLARESKYPELEIPAGFGSLMPFAISPIHFSRTSLDQARISVNTSEDSLGPNTQQEGKLWRTGAGINKKEERENCYPAGEAKRWSPRKGLQNTSTSKGFDGAVSSRISEECVGDMTDSDCDFNSTRQGHATGTYSSFVSVTASDGFGDGSGDFGLESREIRLASTELRDSTIDFRTALMEREQRSRDDLLKLAQDFDGAGAGDRNEVGEEKEEHSKDSKA